MSGDRPAAAALRPLVRRALEERRRHLRRILASPEGRAAPAPPAARPAADDEEALRRFMIVLWPAVRRAPHEAEVRDRFLGGLLDLETAAHGADLRYLDAWNNAYESIADWPPALLARPEVQKALAAYDALLGAHAAALPAGEPEAAGA